MRCGGSGHRWRLDRVRPSASEFLALVLTRPGYTLWERRPVSCLRPGMRRDRPDCRWLTFDGKCRALLSFAAWRGNLHGVRFWRVGEESLRGPYFLLGKNDSTTKTVPRHRPSATVLGRISVSFELPLCRLHIDACFVSATLNTNPANQGSIATPWFLSGSFRLAIPNNQSLSSRACGRMKPSPQTLP